MAPRYSFDDLVLDRPLERALGVLHVDAGERVRAG